MLKAAIEKILSLSEPHVLEIGGETYTDKRWTAFRTNGRHAHWRYIP